MRALTLRPGPGASMEVRELPPPSPGPRELLVRGLALGVCGTDREIAGGHYGTAPAGRDWMVTGHESLGRVEQAPPGSGFSPGDLVVGVVRRPDPVPCGACARGHFDMCRNGRYRERGIKELDGYGAEYWTVECDYAVGLDPRLEAVGMLLEPTAVVVKAWQQVDLVGSRSWFEPRRVLVTGAGPIGLLAALVGVERGLEVHVLDRVERGPKPRLVRSLGAEYHSGAPREVMDGVRPDVVVEATGAAQVVFAALSGTAPYGVLCLTGVSSAGRRVTVDAGMVNRELVLENDVVVGSVNANLDHYRQAAAVLARADGAWLDGLVTRRVPLDRFREAFAPRDDDVKVVIDLHRP
ncbi:glucose 1-dehydrogenase [Streptomyces somaliensis DSM 40738]|uniref:2-deoxy-scyllo-inosamine dehydrogenase n=1 Tax=Streptomyces somaliensis (strain ATCC 33201 / DSM 40738 / JCM 12659 / KCTC 9044 / NCTC 11332 / NRRL B-12077 / IP 733) TaxID=1134445 RepID=A0AA44DBF7_STRE0|nr:glucose 1-dehydrogenase [Streptomyces somaliensis]MCQ0025457.1 glucose 1-dehydrogenase [Streptomyces somaliensis DSM 40738]NKY13290.1 glucose 1-dehydrogenase [Streptomyces somaliensis DSM 40738]